MYIICSPFPKTIPKVTPFIFGIPIFHVLLPLESKPPHIL